MYSKDEYHVFGYKDETKKENGDPYIAEKTVHLPKFKYNMEENMLFGKYCKSGMAVIIPNSDPASTKKNVKRMMCVKMDQVKTNLNAGTA